MLANHSAVIEMLRPALLMGHKTVDTKIGATERKARIEVVILERQLLTCFRLGFVKLMLEVGKLFVRDNALLRCRHFLSLLMSCSKD